MGDGARVTIAVDALGADEVVRVAREAAVVTLRPDAVAAMARSRQLVEQWAASGDPAYGISTGFGGLATQH